MGERITRLERLDEYGRGPRTAVGRNELLLLTMISRYEGPRTFYCYAPNELRSARTNDFTTDAAIEYLSIKSYQTIIRDTIASSASRT